MTLIRSSLFENSREQLRELIEEIVGIQIISIHSDVSTKTGEKVIVLTTSDNLEERKN